ncbi:MAG: creatininase family protein [Candidatus Methanomethylophilaceae archaeon]
MEEMTSKEFSEKLEGNPWLILPLGATEAHGVHLPLGTDSFQPQWVADRLGERTSAIVAPLLPYGNHSSTRRMPGTVNLGFDTLRALLRDILFSLADNGLRRFLLISGHAGSAHMTALREACKELVEAREVTVLLLADYDLAQEHGARCGIDPSDGHGGALETARVMAIRPDTVRQEMVRGGFVSPGYRVLPDPERCFPQGMAGDPSKATAAMGQEINLHIVDRLVEIMEKENVNDD